MIRLTECSKYIIYYGKRKTLFEVRTWVFSDGSVDIRADHPSFVLRYTLEKGLDEASVWLDTVRAELHVNPAKALDVIEEILNEGKVVEESSCR